MRGIIRFIEATFQELNKVNWPTPQQARNLTIVVLVISFAVGAYISFFDYIFGLIERQLIGG